MDEIPADVWTYLASTDSLVKAQLLSEDPSLRDRLAAPETRTAILAWLSRPEARAPEVAGVVVESLNELRASAAAHEAPVARAFLVHPDPRVRRVAYEFLLTLYFPDRDREALLMLVNGMLLDADDGVRSEGARYLERAGLAAQLAGVLESWLDAAPSRGWAGSESEELIRGLVGR